MHEFWKRKWANFKQARIFSQTSENIIFSQLCRVSYVSGFYPSWNKAHDRPFARVCVWVYVYKSATYFARKYRKRNTHYYYYYSFIQLISLHTYKWCTCVCLMLMWLSSELVRLSLDGILLVVFPFIHSLCINISTVYFYSFIVTLHRKTSHRWRHTHLPIYLCHT